MDDRARQWHPEGEELERILDEMRPIIAEFARRAHAALIPLAAATLR